MTAYTALYNLDYKEHLFYTSAYIKMWKDMKYNLQYINSHCLSICISHITVDVCTVNVDGGSKTPTEKFCHLYGCWYCNSPAIVKATYMRCTLVYANFKPMRKEKFCCNNLHMAFILAWYQLINVHTEPEWQKSRYKSVLLIYDFFLVHIFSAGLVTQKIVTKPIVTVTGYYSKKLAS